jgi:hypothetical protein
VDELTRASKVVFSSTLQAPLSWANSQLVSGDTVEAVRAMKRDGAAPLRTIGCQPDRCRPAADIIAIDGVRTESGLVH